MVTSRLKAGGQVWRAAKMRTFYHQKLEKDEEYPIRTDAKVFLNDGKLTVKYDDPAVEGGHVVYEGQESEKGSGHWHLSGSDGGSATLHRFSPESIILEGGFDDGSPGMWRIALFDDLHDAQAYDENS